MKLLTLTQPEARALLDTGAAVVRREVKLTWRRTKFIGITDVIFNKQTISEWDVCNPVGTVKKLAEALIPLCPLGKVSDELWCKERWCRVTDAFVAACEAVGYEVDKYFKSVQEGSFRDGDTVFNWEKPDVWKFTTASKMPKWASRLTVRITSITVEQVDGRWEWVCGVEKI